MSTEADATTVEGAADALAKKIAGSAPAPESTGNDEADDGEQSATELAEGDEGGDGQADEGSEEEGDEPETEDEPEEDSEEPAKVDENAKVKVRVGDKEQEVTVADLKNGYMMRSDYIRKTQEVAAARTEFIKTAKEYEGKLATRVEEVGFLAQILMKQLVEGDQNTNWQELRRTNPAEFAARQEDIRQKQAHLQRAHQIYLQQQESQKQIGTQEQQQALAEEAEKLPVLIPEWIDASVAAREKKAIGKYLMDTFKAEPDDLKYLTDSRDVALIRKAMLYDRLMAEKEQAKAKLRKPVPKFQKAGIRDPNPTRSAQVKLSDAARKTGKVEDYANALASKYR